MPELPEVEIFRQNINPHVAGFLVSELNVFAGKLRWPISPELLQKLPGQKVSHVSRRGKYLLFHTSIGCAILHLGMTGKIKIISDNVMLDNHDHLDLVFSSGKTLRLNDVRRFSSFHWTDDEPEDHKYLRGLGPEPLSREFNSTYLYEGSRKRKVCVKQLLMNSSFVSGIGNIYANEILFHAGILPNKKASKLSRKNSQQIVTSVKEILQRAIDIGGTMMNCRDGIELEGQYFEHIMVYQRQGHDCFNCSGKIMREMISKRSTYFCSQCQR